jgi:hypothetical protein
MSIIFVNETGDAAQDAAVNEVTAKFALLNWPGKCGNLLQAYDDGLEEVRPLSPAYSRKSVRLVACA